MNGRYEIWMACKSSGVELGLDDFKHRTEHLLIAALKKKLLQEMHADFGGVENNIWSPKDVTELLPNLQEMQTAFDKACW